MKWDNRLPRNVLAYCTWCMKAAQSCIYCCKNLAIYFTYFDVIHRLPLITFCFLLSALLGKKFLQFKVPCSICCICHQFYSSILQGKVKHFSFNIFVSTRRYNNLMFATILFLFHSDWMKRDLFIFSFKVHFLGTF